MKNCIIISIYTKSIVFCVASLQLKKKKLIKLNFNDHGDSIRVRLTVQNIIIKRQYDIEERKQKPELMVDESDLLRILVRIVERLI